MFITKKQWRSWSLPSKLTAIGTLLSALSLGVYLIEKTHEEFTNSEETISSKNATAVSGISNTGEIEIKGNVDIQSNGDSD